MGGLLLSKRTRVQIPGPAIGGEYEVGDIIGGEEHKTMSDSEMLRLFVTWCFWVAVLMGLSWAVGRICRRDKR